MDKSTTRFYGLASDEDLVTPKIKMMNLLDRYRGGMKEVLSLTCTMRGLNKLPSVNTVFPFPDKLKNDRLWEVQMAFKTHKSETNNFASPQEMFQDNKLKSIKGILDYQSQIINHYLETIDGTKVINKNVAFELPTGSGKTLVGMLIAEFHRRKYGRKCLFLCPTKQLVSQVCSQCKNQYGIDALPFIGKQAEYSAGSKTKYILAQAVGVTTYSAFFAINSFFDDTDILIFDDVHSSESYIIDNWSLNITRDEYPTLFHQVSTLLKEEIGESGFNRMQADSPFSGDIMNWNDLLPRPKIMPKLKKLEEILSIGTQETKLRFAWSRIADNLSDCQLYISWSSILIRPYIPPTESHAAFSKSLQRIFMSATLGNSGELERITGCQKIKRLPIVSDWDTKGLGRRLFVFPDLSLDADAYETILTRLHQEAKHSVMIVPSDNDAREISAFLKESIPGIDVFFANDLIESKEKYCKSDNAIVIMANRFDGIDFPDNESRMLFIYNLPKVTHLQEKFFVGKMAASLLYSERIKTRIVQAVGRCTRNASDYSVVCILGDSVLNDLTSPKIQSTYHPELRAEISFGVNNSTDFQSVDDIVENVNFFYERGVDWNAAEADIVELRNQFVAEGKDTAQEIIYSKLLNSAQTEVSMQYDLWRKNYQAAYEKSIQIIEQLNAPSLSGYKCFWQYICGSLADVIGDKAKAKYYFMQACDNNKGGIRWLPDLAKDDCVKEEAEESDFFFDIVASLEANLLKLQKSDRFEQKARAVLDGLLSSDGITFEKSHLDLGIILGYDAHNFDDTAAPDPYWIINDELCIVAEDKIYEDEKKEIPVSHVTQAGRHSVWIRENVKTLNRNARIITIFVTNTVLIEESARTFGKDIYYVNRSDLYGWAVTAINALRSARSKFQEDGDADWRAYTKALFSVSQVTPKAFLNFVTRKVLSSL